MHRVLSRFRATTFSLYLITAISVAAAMTDAAVAHSPPAPGSVDEAIVQSADFLASHPDLRFRVDGLAAYGAGDYTRAMDAFLQATHHADKASQAIIGEMHWSGHGVPVDRALAYAWMLPNPFPSGFFIVRRPCAGAPPAGDFYSSGPAPHCLHRVLPASRGCARRIAARPPALISNPSLQSHARWRYQRPSASVVSSTCQRRRTRTWTHASYAPLRRAVPLTISAWSIAWLPAAAKASAGVAIICAADVDRKSIGSAQRTRSVVTDAGR